MKAVAIVPGTNAVRIVERPEPQIASPDEVKVRVLQVGICGTDREEASGGRARAPDRQQELVIGHEMFGRVVETGDAVRRVRTGDYVVLTVRRGCGTCFSCLAGRPDMCGTGDYRERGIWGLDGFQSEFVVDREAFAVPVPPELRTVGVLTEPMSVAEKAIDEAIRMQSSRVPRAALSSDWLHGRRCLVAGLGPIGLLAAAVLRLRGAQVYGLDIVDENSVRPGWLVEIGGAYLDARGKSLDDAARMIKPVDLIFEATGVAPLEFSLLDALALNGVYVLTGIPGGDRPLEIPGAEIIRNLVLRNQVMIGSVNASRSHYQNAVDDLLAARLRWGDHLDRLISHRHPFSDCSAALQHHGEDEIKVVVEWSAP